MSLILIITCYLNNDSALHLSLYCCSKGQQLVAVSLPDSLKMCLKVQNNSQNSQMRNHHYINVVCLLQLEHIWSDLYLWHFVYINNCVKSILDDFGCQIKYQFVCSQNYTLLTYIQASGPQTGLR